MTEIKSVLKNNTYKKSYLANVEIEKVHLDIEAAINAEIYLRPDITREEFAKQVKLSSHQLSEYLSKFTGKRFNDLINDHRVDHAKGLLRDHPETDILSIAYESGFQTKSAFQRAFSRRIDCTPSEYRKRNRQ